MLSEDGTKSAIADGDAGVKALPFMVDGIKDGAAPKAVTTYMEPESLTAFQTGKYAYMRNWPYAYALNQKAKRVKDNFDVGPQPTFEGGGKAGILGGHNSVISAYSKNPGGAAEADRLHRLAGDPEGVRGAVLAAAGARRRLRRPGGQEGDAVRGRARARASRTRVPGRCRPVYPQISQAIYKNVNAALSGQTVAGGRDQAGPVGHREGAGDLLGHG